MIPGFQSTLCTLKLIRECSILASVGWNGISITVPGGKGSVSFSMSDCGCDIEEMESV